MGKTWSGKKQLTTEFRFEKTWHEGGYLDHKERKVEKGHDSHWVI